LWYLKLWLCGAIAEADFLPELRTKLSLNIVCIPVAGDICDFPSVTPNCDAFNSTETGIGFFLRRVATLAPFSKSRKYSVGVSAGFELQVGYAPSDKWQAAGTKQACRMLRRLGIDKFGLVSQPVPVLKIPRASRDIGRGADRQSAGAGRTRKDNCLVGLAMGIGARGKDGGRENQR
jgi:hypothetical protein